MSRLAIFVEGQTELVFMERLLFELLGYQGLRVERERFTGDIFSKLSARGTPEDAAAHTVLIVDCTGDGNVLSAMLDRADRLQRAGWAAVIGLRDL